MTHHFEEKHILILQNDFDFQSCASANEVSSLNSNKRILRIVKILRVLKIIRIMKAVKVVECVISNFKLLRSCWLDGLSFP